jgi:GT2 family glycosyltransferase
MSVTGACLMLRTAFARRLGGFDEQYVVGDFEDTDLCLRARASGFASAVDLDVRLCHLGRSSQVPTTERWRMNLTLYNAWLHQRRWAPALDAMLSEPRGVVESVG